MLAETDIALRAFDHAIPPGVLLAVARLSSDAKVIAAQVDGRIVPVWTNPAVDRLLGGAPGHVLTGGLDALGLGAATAPASAADGGLLSALLNGGGGTADVDVRRADGSTIMVRLNVAPIDGDGERFLLLTLREIEDRVWADAELRASEERFRVVAAHAPIGVFASEVGLRLGYVNERFAELWGREMHEVLGTGWLDSIHDEEQETITDAVMSVLAGAEIALQTRVTRPDGTMRWVRLRATSVILPGRGAGFVGSVEDVTEAMRHEAALSHQAHHDPLTGLPNRSLLADEIQRVLAQRSAGDPAVALLFFDLDNFKLVNDTLGHAAGDQLLVEVAQRLKRGVRDGDTVARFGGDEFVVLCSRVSSERSAMTVASRLREAVAEPVLLNGQELVATASVGVVVTSDLTVAVEALVANADIAMYQAKEAGRNRCALFDEQVRSELEDRLALVRDLRRAIDHEELSVAFQPVIDVPSGRLTSVEALLRWNHPTRGPVRPDEIIAVAEETGMIDAVGSWVLKSSCDQLAEWRSEFGAAAPKYIAVNVSGHQLNQIDLPDLVEQTLRAAGLQGPDLCLELTESVLMRNVESTMSTMNALKALGVRLAIDDFGTGYSSLAYLKRFPVEVLKVDRSFVSHLTVDGEDAAIVAAVVALAHALGLKVVAEGVETPEQLAELRHLGCTFAQGYLLGRPAAAEIITDRIRQLRSAVC
jgi:diguanylate cyclase (GGDEF)-like protein/PAS domain S-box-containing protein